MNKLEQYRVVVEILAYGESPEDAVEYVTEACASSGILECDGIFGYHIPDDSVEGYDMDTDREDI